MTDEEAAWVRANVWPQSMRKTEREVPHYAHTCACQYGLTSWCQHDQHSQCHRGTPQPGPAGYVCGGPGGQTVLGFAEPYEYPTPSACGPRPITAAMFWLADRVCRWVCPCICHLTGPVTIRPAEDALFEVVA